MKTICDAHKIKFAYLPTKMFKYIYSTNEYEMVSYGYIWLKKYVEFTETDYYDGPIIFISARLKYIDGIVELLTE